VKAVRTRYFVVLLFPQRNTPLTLVKLFNFHIHPSTIVLPFSHLFFAVYFNSLEEILKVCLSTEHDQNHDTLEYSFSEKDYTLFFYRKLKALNVGCI